MNLYATCHIGNREEMLPNKSRDEKQRSEAAPKRKKKRQKKESYEDESNGFELLQYLLPELDWVMPAHTHVAHRSATPAKKGNPA